MRKATRYATLALAILGGCHPCLTPDEFFDRFCLPQDVSFRPDECLGDHIVNSVYWNGNFCVDEWRYSCHCIGDDCDWGFGSIDECNGYYEACIGGVCG